jgi:hypothetical protein
VRVGGGIVVGAALIRDGLVWDSLRDEEEHGWRDLRGCCLWSELERARLDRRAGYSASVGRRCGKNYCCQVFQLKLVGGGSDVHGDEDVAGAYVLGRGRERG